jgi:hypothetical protein
MATRREQVERTPDSDELLSEARRIVDEGRRRGLTLRLVGGLAVRELCRDVDFCGRPYRDIDLVCLRPELKRVATLLADLGFSENRHYRLASGGRMAQFFHPCIHGEGGGAAHVDDRVDLFVDAFHLDHEIRLVDRLGLGGYTTSPSDVLLTKLQRASVNRDDLADIVTLLKDLPLLRGDGPDVIAPDAIDASYIARLCARDWGLHHDVTRNLARCRAHLTGFELGDDARRRVLGAVAELEAALDGAPKSLRWRLRSLFGEAFPWHDTVDEREGVRIGRLEGV